MKTANMWPLPQKWWAVQRKISWFLSISGLAFQVDNALDIPGKLSSLPVIFCLKNIYGCFSYNTTAYPTDGLQRRKILSMILHCLNQILQHNIFLIFLQKKIHLTDYKPTKHHQRINSLLPPPSSGEIRTSREQWFKFTSKNMPKLPLDIMEIPCNKFLSWWLLWEILHGQKKREMQQHLLRVTTKRSRVKYTTNGGKTFSAARRGTENPPWVLVSLAVNVLQK